VPDAAASGPACGFQDAAVSGTQPATSRRTERATRGRRPCAAPFSTLPPIPPTSVGQCFSIMHLCKYMVEKGELSVPGPLRHSYVRRATAHAHTIPNLKPEIWTKHCVTPSSISYDSYFISLSSLSLSLLEPDLTDQSSRSQDPESSDPGANFIMCTHSDRPPGQSAHLHRCRPVPPATMGHPVGDRPGGAGQPACTCPQCCCCCHCTAGVQFWRHHHHHHQQAGSQPPPHS
jgi:hypothetical protein